MCVCVYIPERSHILPSLFAVSSLPTTLASYYFSLYAGRILFFGHFQIVFPFPPSSSFPPILIFLISYPSSFRTLPLAIYIMSHAQAQLALDTQAFNQ